MPAANLLLSGWPALPWSHLWLPPPHVPGLLSPDPRAPVSPSLPHRILPKQTAVKTCWCSLRPAGRTHTELVVVLLSPSPSLQQRGNIQSGSQVPQLEEDNSVCPCPGWLWKPSHLHLKVPRDTSEHRTIHTNPNPSQSSLSLGPRVTTILLKPAS